MPGIFSSLLASKPSVPKLATVDLAKQQQDAIKANQAALPGAEALAGDVNTFNYAQLQKMLADAIPGFSDIQSTASGNILSQLKGEIPQDVQDQIMRSSAFKSLRGGYGGGGMSNAVTARDLGLTSLDLTNKGLDSATKWISLARTAMTPGQFDVSSMFITPAQKYQSTNEQNVQQFQRQFAKNTNDANFSWGNRLGPLADAVGGMALAAGGMALGGGGGAALGMLGGMGGQQNASPDAMSWYKNGTG